MTAVANLLLRLLMNLPPANPHRLFRSGILVFLALMLGIVARAVTDEELLRGWLPRLATEPYDLPYRYYVPPSYDPRQSYPLIVYLHGSAEIGDDNQLQLGWGCWGAYQMLGNPQYPCFLVAPQAHTNWDGTTQDQIVRMIRTLSATYSIDPDRVYVTGISMGGYGSWSIINRHPYVFAAAVPMSGAAGGNFQKIAHIPIWDFHAAKDETVGVSGSDNAVSNARLAGGRVIYTRYADGSHAIWLAAYANPRLLPWLLAQRRNRPALVDPFVQITSPANRFVAASAEPTRDVVGVAALSGGVTKVNWTFAPTTGYVGIDTSALPLATGTTSWSVAAAPVAATSTQFMVIATGPSLATPHVDYPVGNGVTTVNDSFWNVPLGADLTAPTIAIQQPSATGTARLAGSTLLSLVGTTTPAAGKTVSMVTWSNNRGGQGGALGTAPWSVTDINLEPGDNVITVTARDSVGITASASITVTSLTGGTTGTYGNNGQPWTIPAAGLRLEAENYDEGGEGIAYHDRDLRKGTSTVRSGGTANEVDLMAIAAGADAPGLKVGSTLAGEWLRYTLTVPATGRYKLRLRVANSTASAASNAVALRWKGRLVAGPLTVPSTGAADTFVNLEVPEVVLSAGTGLLEVDCYAGNFELNWLELTPVGVVPFASWIAGYFPGGAASTIAPTTDPDGDGLTNLLEYALGRAPNAATPGLAPTVWTDAGTGSQHAALTFKRAKGANVVAEISDDLATWTSDAASIVQVGAATPDATGLYETVTFRSTATLAAKPRQFLRVRMTSP